MAEVSPPNTSSSHALAAKVSPENCQLLTHGHAEHHGRNLIRKLVDTIGPAPPTLPMIDAICGSHRRAPDRGDTLAVVSDMDPFSGADPTEADSGHGQLPSATRAKGTASTASLE